MICPFDGDCKTPSIQLFSVGDANGINGPRMFRSPFLFSSASFFPIMALPPAGRRRTHSTIS